MMSDKFDLAEVNGDQLFVTDGSGMVLRIQREHVARLLEFFKLVREELALNIDHYEWSKLLKSVPSFGAVNVRTCTYSPSVLLGLPEGAILIDLDIPGFCVDGISLSIEEFQELVEHPYFKAKELTGAT